MRNTIPIARTGQPSRGRVASSQRSVAILDALADAGALGTNEVARRVGTTASTASRQLGTLLDAGLVEFDPATRRYRLGLRLVQLGNSVLAPLDVRNVARGHLEALVADGQGPAALSVPRDPDALAVGVGPPDRQRQ